MNNYFHVIALICQAIMILTFAMGAITSHIELMGALGWFAAFCYNLGNMETNNNE